MEPIAIDEPEAVETVIYVHSHAYNVFLAGWGVIIDRQGETTELYGVSNDENAPRLLLRALLRALIDIPKTMPVRVVCTEEWLPRWTIGRLDFLSLNAFREARKKANPDLVIEVCKQMRRHPFVRATHARSGEWPTQLERAAELARDCGGLGKHVQYPNITRPNKPKPRPASERLAATMANDVHYDDLPWDP